MHRLLRSDSGQTIVELIIAMTFMLVVMVALSGAFTSGLRATSDQTSQAGSQGDVRSAVERLEYEARCSSSVTILSSGAGVALALPGQCPHANGTVSWCVSGGALSRFTTTDCTGTGLVFIRNVTSATPFCLQTTSGDLPELHVSLTANLATRAPDQSTQTSRITLRNAAVATSTSAACP